MLRRIYRTLRSRRFALGLMIGIAAYAAVLTVLEIPNPYSNPLFLLIAAALTVSTAACAWERTSGAFRTAAQARGADRSLIGDASRRPSFAVPVPSEVADDVVMAAAAAAFKRCRLRCTSRDGAVAGSAHRIAHWGSPLFHWSLVALFVFVALGQLTSAAGFIDITVGSSVPDTSESYGPGSPVDALFCGRYTGVDIRVERIVSPYVSGGVDRGDSPRVSISKDGKVLARQQVYPNNPMRYGSLTIHQEMAGPALIVSFRSPGSREAMSVPVFFERAAAGQPPAAVSLQVRSADGSGTDMFELAPQLGQRVVVQAVDAVFESPPLAAGDTTRLPDGTEMRVVAFTEFARLRVVNDWTLPFIFACFALVTVAPLTPLFWPPRAARAALAQEDATLSVWVSQRRSDPAFRGRVERAVRDEIRGLGGSVAEDEDRIDIEETP
jgi:cytochrome c biogenesis protein ResB